jgi:hypothetical protein
MQFLIFLILAIVLWAAGTALVLWIGYRLVVSAIRQGVLEANAEQARRDYGQPPSGPSTTSRYPPPTAAA